MLTLLAIVPDAVPYIWVAAVVVPLASAVTYLYLRGEAREDQHKAELLEVAERFRQTAIEQFKVMNDQAVSSAVTITETGSIIKAHTAALERRS